MARLRHRPDVTELSQKCHARHVLGLTPDETLAYGELITMPSATAAEFAEALGAFGTSPGEAHLLLRRLEEYGLAARITGDERRFAAAPPAIALGAMLARQQDEVRHAEIELSRLDEAYRLAAAGRGPTDVVDVIHGEDAVRHRFEQVQLGARERVDAFVRPPVIVTSSQENSAENKAVERGVKYRVVVERSMLESHDVTVDEAIEATEAGEEVRFADQVPLKLLVVDRRLALMPLTSSGDVVGALLVRESTLLDALIALFENVWDRATAMLVGTSGLTGDLAKQVDDEDAQVLGLLLAGLTDQAVAKQLGTSLRTVQRRVRALLDLAGVETRMQLGWHAATHGWVQAGADGRFDDQLTSAP
ncbi:sugar-specific transcriptional regulator TrmB [Nocardioides luteus]|uniref:HTH luxR-type domain-containing protein n=1 Tax=Nocardioides luteus TaxID=1844 RepID=A0ABQ5T1K6_9ACTN|nr:helix-turn-helix domain-containing protein [Nocardioides luteus]MDR7310470.1 sugar-specific transcriptional regulator TrmB [Nocardioides luteus]GGR73599.1 hypothetical protein GCM10010197_46100 [Nocardioides luteus]GLJ69750.1 hypothetical protein GCM10017579_37860 [Nocardioides luteus]